MTYKAITGTVIGDDDPIRGKRPAIERAMEGEVVTFAEVEKYYKQPGGTLMQAWFGADPFDFWVGRFYVGTFGVVSMAGIVIGTLFYFYQVYIIEGVRWNILQARLDPPPISNGLSLAGPGEPGFMWQVIVFAATIAFIGWAMRQVDLSRKLDMTYEIPIAYGAVVSSWITLQYLRPIAMGAWGNGFALGITHHLDWVSNIGYQYFNFFYNPFHAVAISLFFLAAFVLSLHGSFILMMADRPYKSEENVDSFARNIQGYSIGEIGIHRLSLWVGVASVLFANVCIYLTGTFVADWTGFWDWWTILPIWESLGVASAATATIIMGAVIWRGRRDVPVDPDDVEYGGIGIEGTAIRRPYRVRFLERLFDLGQLGPIYLGISGTISVFAGGIATFIILESFGHEVGYDFIAYTREFWVLAVNPPPYESGFGAPSWYAGGDWIVATSLLHVAVIAWAVRIYNRSRAAGIGPQLTLSFVGALFLYFVIYFIRPVILGNWAQAPGQGFRAVLDWTNALSVQYGNFYYNPFHMLSIFFLFGATLLLAMHGATIVASSKYGSYREVEEMMAEGTGTHRSQLFWRWCMGFNVNSKSIHYWAIWFAAGVAITGGIGVLLTGTIVLDWFDWAVQSGFVAPPF